MDRAKGIKNVAVSIFFKFVLTIGAIIVRRLLIQYIGNEANGLNSLYLSVIGFLAVAELGIGEAITFCMYKPIVEGQKEKVSALYLLFKKVYTVIGAIIFVGGLIIMLFLPYIAKDYSDININIYRTFFLTLLSVTLTYLYSAKMSLLNAYKYNYISTTITSCGTIVEYILKSVIIILTQSFEGYLVCRIVSVVLQWGVVSNIVKKKFDDIISRESTLDKESKKTLLENIKAMFMHKIGNVLVNTADSIIISAFIGVVLLGKYSNYTSIIVAMTSVLSLFFYPLVSVIGHAFVNISGEKMKDYFYFFYGFNYLLGVIFCLGYYAVIDDLIMVLYGKGLSVSESIVFVITLNYFIQFLRTSIMTFRTSTGVFYYDRWKPLFEGIVNVILSIALVQTIGIVGVIVATIITNLFVCDIIEPYVVFKYGFKEKVKSFYVSNYLYVLLFTVCLYIMKYAKITSERIIIELFVNGIISICIAVIPIVIVLVTNKSFRRISHECVIKIIKKGKAKL